MTNKDYSANNSGYLKANPTWHVEDSPWKATQVLEMIKRNNIKPASLAEIGCGAGEILIQLHQRMDNTTIQFAGFEIAPDAFALCRQREKERLHYFQDDLLQTPNQYDLLLVMDVFEHVDDYIGFVNKCGARAAYKIYHIPLDISILSIITNYPIAARKNVGHLHYFMKDTALATITDAGQEVVDWFYTRGAFEVNNKGLSFAGKVINIFRRFFYWIKPGLAVKTFGGFSLIVLTK